MPPQLTQPQRKGNLHGLFEVKTVKKLSIITRRTGNLHVYLWLNISDATEHSRKFRNLPQCVSFVAFDWTVETMTRAAKKAKNQYRDDAIFQYKNREVSR